MTWIQYEQFLLALCAWREARGESEQGILAVMHVIRNRVRANLRSFGIGWHGVITKPHQFSSMSTFGDPQLVAFPRPQSEQFGWMLGQAAAIHAGGGDDPTNGALFYWNPLTATSEWFKDNVATKHAKVASIGNHEFFA